jgi:hypothetical protein
MPENGPENGPETPPTWQAQLRDDNIRFVRVVWCDNGNQIRGKALHIDALTRQMEGGRAWGVGLSAAQQAIPVVADRGPRHRPGAGGRGVADARLGNVATAALRPRSGSGDGEHGQRRASTALPRGIRCLTRYSRILERCRRRRGAIAALLSSPSRWQNPWRPWSRIRYCWMPWVSPWPRRTWRCGGPNWPPWQA